MKKSEKKQRKKLEKKVLKKLERKLKRKLEKKVLKKLEKKQGKKLERKLEERLQAERQPTHAGGVVWREVHGMPEFLLVTASKPPERWVFPKGGIKPKETPKRAAVREVREESGVDGEVMETLGDATLRSKGELKRVRFFLMRVSSKPRRSSRKWRGEGRKVEWLPAAATRHRLRYAASKQLLSRAVELLSSSSVRLA